MHAPDDDVEHFGQVQEQLRSTDAHVQLVGMLKENPYSDLAHRILLVFQTIADKEADRKLLVSCDCASALKPFLVSSFSPEVVLTLAQSCSRSTTLNVGPMSLPPSD